MGLPLVAPYTREMAECSNAYSNAVRIRIDFCGTVSDAASL
jgi:hypothetical protein